MSFNNRNNKVYISEVPPIVLRNPGKDGTSGTSGLDGTFFGSSGTSGVDGTFLGSSGTSGTSGLSGVSGSSGTSGVSGSSGVSGTSGVSGSDGTSGVRGSSGTSGESGSSGTSGESGSSGVDGTSGTSGFSIDSGSFATTGSNTFIGDETISGSILISGSIIPATANGTFTSSFSLGSPTNAWKDLYISHGSIIFVDAITQATSSFSIENNAGGTDTVKYTAAITASRYLGDGSRLTNLPSTTNWNKDKEYVVRNTEQLTFSGDYILEDCALYIDGGVTNTIGNWIPVNLNGDGTITRTSNNTYRIDGPNDDEGDGYLIIKKYFDTETTMSIEYEWRNSDSGEDWPIYDVSEQDPTEPDIVNRLDDNGANFETGSWTINVPANRWVAIGVYSTDSCCGSGSLSITLPYLPNEDSVQYSTNKYFKKEGKIFIGGNLLVKDSYIENNGQISVGGEVILIGDSQIEGTGIII